MGSEQGHGDLLGLWGESQLPHQRHEARLPSERIEDSVSAKPPHPLRIGRVRPLEVIERMLAIAQAELHNRHVERENLAAKRPLPEVPDLCHRAIAIP